MEEAPHHPDGWLVSQVETNTVTARIKMQRISAYQRNLRNERKNVTAENYFFIFPECDKNGKLLKTKFARVQMIGVKTARNLGQYVYNSVLVCHFCNFQDQSVRQVLIHGNTTSEFIASLKQQYCIHCNVVEEENPLKYFLISEDSFPWDECLDTPDV